MTDQLTLTVDEAAAVLRFSPRTLRDALKNPEFVRSVGAFQLTGPGGHWRIPRASLAAFLGMTTSSS